jgi:hypothetical protein
MSLMLKVCLHFEFQGFFFAYEYLGLPLEALFKAKSIWDDIIEKIRVSLGQMKVE